MCSVATPFDQSFKILSDDDPRALLAAFAGIPLEAELRLETLNSELTQGVLRVDKLYQCERPAGEPFLVHFEAVSTFRNDTLAKQAAYIRGIVEKYKRPVRSYMLLMRKGGVPETLTRWLEEDFGDYKSLCRMRYVRVWRLPAHRLLALERAALYPWTVLADAHGDEVAEAAVRLWNGRYERYFVQLKTLGGLRYGEGHPFVKELEHMPVDEVLQDSKFYQEFSALYHRKMDEATRLGLERGEELGIQRGMRKGMQQGMQQGIEQGMQQGHRDSLRRVLTIRFGALPPWASERIAGAREPELIAWLDRSVTSQSVEEALLPPE